MSSSGSPIGRPDDGGVPRFIRMRSGAAAMRSGGLTSASAGVPADSHEELPTLGEEVGCVENSLVETSSHRSMFK